MPATILSVIAYKGGAGKTTLSINLAGAFVSKGRRVLVVDADPQGASGLALNAQSGKPTLYEVLHRRAEPREAIRTTAIDGLDVLVSDLDLAGAELDLTSQKGWQQRMAEVLAHVRPDYDRIVIDSGPGLAGLPAMSMAAADNLLVTVRPGGLQDVMALRQALHTAERARRPVLGIVANQVGRRTLLQDDALADIGKVAGGLLMKTYIPMRVQIAEAALAGLPITKHQPNSDAAAAFLALAEEVDDRA